MARAVARLTATVFLLVSVLLVDPRPGWCPFANPAPGGEVAAPAIPTGVTPTPESTPPPEAQETPSAERPVVHPRPPQKRQRPARVAWKPHWLTLIGLALAALLLLLLPAAWMRTVFRRFDLPDELQPQTGAFTRSKRKQAS